MEAAVRAARAIRIRRPLGATAVDPLTLGLGLDSPAVSSIVFPVAPPAPEASSIENGEPETETD